ncbi:hypothetical protein RHOSPDRAFT_32711 [Rhodotorula sp. JG-1b]|nr:hypothetical protein RHOSPDRAFT_32711 [Rhodotorula sp. JG-1b]
MSLYVAEQVTGWFGTVLWCIQLVPQVWMNYRRKTTAGLSGALCVCWALSGICLGIYAIIENISIPIIVQPHCYGSLCALMLCQKMYYDKGWSWKAAVAGFAAYAVGAAGFEIAMVFASRRVEHIGSDGLTMTWGILSDVFLAIGFAPQFYEIYKAKEVIGLSYLFLFMDSLGAVFSLVSLACKDQLDIIALIGYVAVLGLEIVIVLLALVLNPRARRARVRDGVAEVKGEGEGEGEKGLASEQPTLVCGEAPTLKCGNVKAAPPAAAANDDARAAEQPKLPVVPV